MRRVAIFALWGACFFLHPAWAQEPEPTEPPPEEPPPEAEAPPDVPDENVEKKIDISEISLEDLLDFKTASSTKTEQRTSEAPSVVSVVSREQTRWYGWFTLNDILYAQPGFAPARDYERRTVSGRGQFETWNNNHLLLLVDGIPHNDTETGSALTWEPTPLFMVKSVEVIRGPGAALYGSNATNGVVALNTLSAADFADSHTEGILRVGDHGTYAYDVVGGESSSLASVVLGISHFETDGNEHMDYDGSGRTDSVSGELAQFRVQDQQASTYLYAKATGEGTLAGLSLQLHHQTWDYETAYGWLWWTPDQAEKMNESRQLVTLRYSPKLAGKLSLEFAGQYQRHHLLHHLRFYADDAFAGWYPAGVWEYVDTAVHDVFARAQASYGLGEGNILGGVEYRLFYYGGDRSHFSNVNLTDAAGGYPPYTGFEPLGPYYALVEDRPVSDLGAYVQWVSGRVLRDLVSATVGARYDAKFFDYTDATGMSVSKSYQQLSPRAGLVFFPHQRVTVKALAGRAFRAPAPVELFGSNSWAVASAIDRLRPETFTTLELAADWRITDRLTWRANGYFMDINNISAYGSLNVIDNIYSRQIIGAESELLVEAELPQKVQLSGYANLSTVELLDEEVSDPNIAPSDDLTWAPAISAKAGVVARWRGASLALRALYQGEAERRSSDTMNVMNAAKRPATVDDWLTFDVNARVRVIRWITLGAQVRNLFDTDGRIIKGGDFPFDYRIEGRRILGIIELHI